MKLTPILHPSSILQGRHALELPQETYLSRALNDPDRELDDITQPPPHSKLYPSLDDMRAFQAHAERMGYAACDIESCGPWPICIGFTAFNLDKGTIGGSICVRIRVKGGMMWCEGAELLATVEWLMAMFAHPDITLAYHNGYNFDVPELQSMGFEMVGEFLDTMAMMHAAYAEMPLSLQFVSTFKGDAPVWKTLTDLDDEGEGKA